MNENKSENIIEKIFAIILLVFVLTAFGAHFTYALMIAEGKAPIEDYEDVYQQIRYEQMIQQRGTE